MAFYRCTGSGGGGGGAIVTFTPKLVFEESGIGSSAWRDTGDTTSMGVQSGTYTATAGEKITVNSSNNLCMYMPIDNSYFLFGIRCKIDPNYSPKQSNNWYDCSCILGQELGGQQRDCAIIIDRNGYFALGTGNSDVNSTNVSALDGQEHELMMLVEADNIQLYIDGVLQKKVTIAMSGNQMIQMGVFWNKSSTNTRVDGEIYAVGYWQAVYPTQQYSLPIL